MKPIRAVVALLLLTVAGCATTPTPALPLEASLRPGQSIDLPGHARLRYVGTFDDSRCPPDVQCIHAGDAEVRLRVEREAGAEDVIIHASDATARTTAPWRITLLRLAHGAAPVATLRVEDALP
ncbi:hypothetical protein [Lysobacter panacisoli]|uniref:Lipoprotein n=1 Tax=Lysobacter panacisoli TaxID=1255263 RepID=A0ABP9LNP1_9GAMM|nr:hypothetical protein [Lysobacter panacisoli]